MRTARSNLGSNATECLLQEPLIISSAFLGRHHCKRHSESERLDDLEDVLGDDSYGAAFSGTDPMLALEYALFPMDTIPALTADAANDITPSMVMRRDETRATKEFNNAQSLLKRAEHLAKWRNGLYCKIKLSMAKSAPLLLQRLQGEPGMAIAGHPGWFNGATLIALLRCLRNAGTEEDFAAHDNVLEWMKYTPLPRVVARKPSLRSA